MTWIDERALPQKMQEFLGLEFGLERLEPDTPEACPCTSEVIEDYLQLETGGAPSAILPQFQFVQTAAINGGRAWLWRRLVDGGEEYLSLFDRGETGSIGVAANWAGLSPDQYLVACYFNRHLFRG